MAWLRELLGTRAADYETRVVFGHVPLWSFAQGREHEYIGDLELERLLQDAGVELFLSGHHHAFYPGHRDGIHHVGQACLGSGPRRLIGSKAASPRGFTVIEFVAGDIRVTAYDLDDPSAPPADWSALPERIRGPGAELIRADRVDPGLDAQTRLPGTRKHAATSAETP
jgi:hypothetical protein